MKKLLYDIKAHDFHGNLHGIFKNNLENFSCFEDLHKIKSYEVMDIYNDQDTIFHKIYYDNYEIKIREIYENFIKTEVVKLFKEDIVYQQVPTFRAHLCNNFAVSEFHKDSDFFHSKEEINFFLPLTCAKGNNTVWVESKKGLEDFSPMNASYGEYIMWDGANLKHGNMKNDTGKSRVSIDFRIIPMSLYVENNSYSISNNTKFTIGDYFKFIKWENK